MSTLQEQTAPSPAASGTSSAPDDRSTTFRAVEGGGESRSGSTLMVEAYCVLWLILLGWLVWLWRRQNGLNARVDGLEKAIDRAAAKAAANDGGKKK